MRHLLSFLLILCWTVPVFSAEGSPKNIILLIADDLGLQCGCYGDKVIQTPNIDALAKNGTRFKMGFASVSSCSPSRATLLTGLPTHQNGQYGLAHATHHQHTFAQVQSLPKLLGKSGYRTAVISKLHVLPKEVYPWDEEINQGTGGGRDVGGVNNAARKFIKESGDKPFFILVGFTDPHRAVKGFANEKNYANVPSVKYDPKEIPLPYHLPDHPEVRQDLADFYQSISRLDHGVGLIQQTLKELGKAENTLVIFLSDNGIPFPGAKTTLYDSGLHLPLMIHAPGKKAGIESEAMASWTDIAPTILDYAGVKPPKEMLGRSLLSILDQPQPTGWDTVYGSHQFHEITMYYPMRMVRTRTHKLILNLAHPLPYPCAADLYESLSWQGILKRNGQMLGERSRTTFEQRPREELYDMTKDPNELKNLIEDVNAAEIVKDLRTKLKEWQTATNDPWLVKDQHE